MACQCKNPDGTLSQVCMGACVQDSKVNSKIFYEELKDLLVHHLEMIKLQVFKYGDVVDEKYAEGFKAGFEMAREIYE